MYRKEKEVVRKEVQEQCVQEEEMAGPRPSRKVVLTALYPGEEPALPSNGFSQNGDDLHLQ
jgi:hypothetical protein